MIYVDICLNSNKNNYLVPIDYSLRSPNIYGTNNYCYYRVTLDRRSINAYTQNRGDRCSFEG